MRLFSSSLAFINQLVFTKTAQLAISRVEECIQKIASDRNISPSAVATEFFQDLRPS